MRKWCVLRIDIRKKALKLMPNAYGLNNLSKAEAKRQVVCRSDAKRGIYYTACPKDINGKLMIQYADTYGLI